MYEYYSELDDGGGDDGWLINWRRIMAICGFFLLVVLNIWVMDLITIDYVGSFSYLVSTSKT
jgi:hypothetical protein